jgi:hypothetical protein
MSTQIEIFYQIRKKYRGAHIFWLVIFTVAWIMRSVLKITNAENETMQQITMVVLLLSLIILAYYAIRFNIVEHKINKDDKLKKALHDELFQLNELKAWKTAFFSVMGFILLIAVFSIFVVISDLMLICITALLIGFGTYSFTLYIRER